MTVPTEYADTTRRAENLLASTLESWRSGVSTVTDQFRAFPTLNTFPQFDATEAVEQQFAVIKRVVDLNHEYARSLAEVANTLTGVTRQQIDSVSSAVHEQVQGVSDAARSGVDTLERTARDQARERYQRLTKNELSDEAGKRGLPKSGTVDELIERLVANDTTDDSK